VFTIEDGGYEYHLKEFSTVLNEHFIDLRAFKCIRYEDIDFSEKDGIAVLTLEK